VSKDHKSTITVLGTEIKILLNDNEDYISLTDMGKRFGGDELIYNWMRNRNTVEFLGIWEQMHNLEFKGGGFATFKTQVGLNNFHLTPKKWIETTNAIGIQTKAGRYGGGTYAHKDIAFEFGSWLSPEFKLYLIKEFQRLKEEENQRLSLGWNLNRTLAKLNYQIHTDAIKKHIIPSLISADQASFVYTSEADVLNVAIFGITAKEWRNLNPDKDGNMREFARVEQLLVLANLESMNAEFIRMRLTQADRLVKLNAIAITQLKSITAQNPQKHLEKLHS
jgi:hypothetical protein